jgi:transposase InsO family protein
MPSNNLKKTEDVLIEIKRLYYNGKKPTASTILQEVNEFLIRSNRKTISISSIYNVIAQYFIKNEASIARHGVKYVEDNLLPYLHFNLPANEDILWLMDGSRFQFAYKSNTNKFNFLVFFIIIDAYNKRIVGYSSDDSENGCMVKKALEMACKKSYSLPREIISDNSSAFKSDDLIKFKGRSKLLGLNWRFIRRQNPRDNAIAERFFGVFQESFCKRYDGYLGDGIKSKYIDGKPSPEEIKKYLSTRSLRSKEELISLLDEIITRYNNSIQRKKSLESDAMNIKYLYNIDPKSQRRFEPIKIDTIKYSELFWPSKAITVKHGEIYFEIDKEAFIYQIYDENLLLKLHGNKVLVRYYPGDMSQILVFDFQTDKYLVTLKRYVNIPKAAIERDEDDNKALFKYSGKSKELKKKLLMRIEKVYEMSEKNRDNLPPKLLEFNIGTKAEKEEIESSVMNEELKKISGFENSEVFSEVIDYDYLFKNLYAKKGSLNIFNNGNS